MPVLQLLETMLRSRLSRIKKARGNEQYQIYTMYTYICAVNLQEVNEMYRCSKICFVFVQCSYYTVVHLRTKKQQHASHLFL